MAEEKQEDTSAQELADAFKAELDKEPKEETPAEEPKKPEEVTPPADPAKEEPKKDDETKPSGEEEKTPEGGKKPEAPEAPGAPAVEEPVAPQPLTKEDVAAAISKVREDERTSSEALETATNEVMKAYYPDGLSNVLIDEKSGKQLKSPQDVVEASGGEMSVEQASAWLTEEQYKLDTKISQIKEDARGIAATTVKFKQDVAYVLEHYKPVFEAYPGVQKEAWDQLNELVKIDEAKSVVLSAPDVRKLYDRMLKPYQTAYEYAQKNPGATPPAPGTPAPVEPKKSATPGVDDRLDEGGDGGQSEVDDPNDFAQQVTKELAKERR